MYGREPKFNVVIIFVLMQSKDFLASFTIVVSVALFNATLLCHFKYESYLRAIINEHLK